MLSRRQRSVIRSVMRPYSGMLRLGDRNLLKRLFQVGKQVPGVFDADGEPHECFRHAEALPFRFRYELVGGAGRVRRQGTDVTQGNRLREQSEAVEEPGGSFPAAPEFE